MNEENRASVTAKIKKLEPILALSGMALREPRETDCCESLQDADAWLDCIIDDFLVEFAAVYDLDHTGIEFWDTVSVLGLQGTDGIMSDLQVCIDMRKILKKFKRRMVKNLPVLFGGTKKKEKHAKAKNAPAT